MQNALKTTVVLLVAGFFPFATPSAEAFYTPHPLQNYHQGLHHLNTYRGDPKQLEQAKIIFSKIIENHPDSPLGYLGMSQLKTIEAYRYGNHYNVKMISEKAMPMAMKAMRYGPTLKIVHDNYDRFEKILSDNELNQDFVSRSLRLNPEKMETYLALAEYLTDQGDYEKALEYYQITLRLATDDLEKVMILRRIAQIYSKDLADIKMAVEYWEAVLAINNNLPTVWEDLGSAYFKLGQYDLSVQNLQKAWDFFSTSQLHVRLLAAQSLASKTGDKKHEELKLSGALQKDNNQNTPLHWQLVNLYYENQDNKSAYFHFINE